MITRKLLAQEYYKKDIISSVAFELNFDYDKIKKEECKEENHEEINGDTPQFIGTFGDDNQTLYGAMGAFPFQINYDGNSVKMSGIGGVSTLPCYRKMGVIRECFKHYITDSYEKGEAFSYLYPFSRAFYRNFGYESNSMDKIWEIELKAFKDFKVGGKTEFLLPDSSLDDVKEIYKKMYVNYNLSINRKEKDFNYFVNRDTFNQKRYAYVWYNNEGVAKAYILFKKVNESGKNVMDCTHSFGLSNDFAFVDAEGFMGMMDFVKTFSANYDSIKFTVPNDICLEGLINEGNFSTCKSELSGMVRVMNVKKVLEISKYLGSGNVKIKINDKYCSENTGVFNIEFKDGKCNSLVKGNGDFDVEMDISTFSALIVGTYPSIKSCLKTDIIIKNENSDIDKVFYSKKNKVLDLF